MLKQELVSQVGGKVLPLLVGSVVLLGALGLVVYHLRSWCNRRRARAVLAERERIAHDLHDSLAQYFTATVLQLDYALRTMRGDPEAALKSLEETRHLVMEARREAKNAVHDLRGHLARPQTLTERIRDLEAKPFLGRPDVTAQINGQEPPLSEGVRSELHKVVQQAVVNAVEHGAPERIAIDVNFSREQLSIRVSDDGRGFDVAVPRTGGRHFGLLTMAERCQKIGGSFEIRSVPGETTVVDISLPCQQRPRPPEANA